LESTPPIDDHAAERKAEITGWNGEATRRSAEVTAANREATERTGEATEKFT
jgi:hypothetical protein